MTTLCTFNDICDWVFDLDNTLYAPHHNLLEQIQSRMTRFIANHFNLPHADAYRLQKECWQQYGTTLFGLMQRYNMHPDAYLAFVHDIDMRALAPADDLRAHITALPGRKFIFTNATRAHALRVITQLGVADLFDGIFDIVTANYIPKPHPAIYDAMLQHFDIDPSSAAFFEDSARNLAPAHARGMTTILVQPETAPPTPIAPTAGTTAGTSGAHIHHHTPDLLDFLRTLTPTPIAASAGGVRGD